jgi:hypothetical protein
VGRFAKAGRGELAEKEAREISILEIFFLSSSQKKKYFKM